MNLESDKFNVAGVRRALVVGAGHGIGCGLVAALRERAPGAMILATYHSARNAKPLLETDKLKTVTAVQVDPLNETELANLRDQLHGEPLDLVVNASGFLHGEGFEPEKSLGSLSLAQLEHTFRVNAFVTPLLAKHLKNLLPRERASAFVALSAKVGSIADNQLGGWYGYRASKAALNMFIKTIALEFERTGLRRCSVLAIHPGTTDTDLSRPFLKSLRHQIWKPEESATHILNTIETGASTGSGLFLNWDGSPLPW